MDLSIVLPCYNEAGNIPELVRRYSALIQGKSIEIILVNNGSKDETGQKMVEALASIPNADRFVVATLEVNEGYGNGILFGLSRAGGRVLAFSHADLQCDPENVIQAYQLYLEKEKLPENRDRSFVVKGERFDRRESEKLLSFNLDRFASLVFGRRVFDINGQPKVFSRAFYETVLIHGPRDLSFDVFLMGAVSRAKLNLYTIPVYFGLRKYGVSSWNTTLWSKLRMVLRFVRTIFLTRIRLLRLGI